MNTKIPTIKYPNIEEYIIDSHNEILVSLKERGFIVYPQYYKQGIVGSYPDCYVRETVANKLDIAQLYLPNGYKFVILDGYRPICVQQILWNSYYQDLKNKHPEFNDIELDFKTSLFVSKPSYDIKHPSLHNTGGAIDLTICDKNNKWLNMGTEFDDFSNKAWTNYFEEYEQNIEIRNNRRLLYNAMIKAGFTNLPSEWWHYDYGDNFWAYFTRNTSIYEGILDVNFQNKI